MKWTLGILGTGQLAVHIVDGLARSRSKFDIVVSPRNAQVAAKLATDHGVTVARDTQKLVDQAKMVLVCLPANSGTDILSELTFRPGQHVCSAMAGVDQETIAKAVAPATASVSMMPGAANAIGRGPCLLYPNDPEWRAVFNDLGRVIPCHTQRDFDVAAVFGAFSGASFVFMQRVALWFTDQGLPGDAARQLVAETTAGNAAVLEQSLQDWDQVVTSVATPGGITEELVRHLEQANALAAWPKGLDVVLERLRRD